MESLKKGFVFWVLLFVSVVIPGSVANAQTTKQVKMGWTATIRTGTTQVGQAQLIRTTKFTWNTIRGQWQLSTDKVDYSIQTYACKMGRCEEGQPWATKAGLAGPGMNAPWERVLCEGTCVLSDEGDLTQEDLIEPEFGVHEWADLSLIIGQEGNMEVRLDDGTKGTGKFKRVF